jgi:hypothetical protein
MKLTLSLWSLTNEEFVPGSCCPLPAVDSSPGSPPDSGEMTLSTGSGLRNDWDEVSWKQAAFNQTLNTKYATGFQKDHKYLQHFKKYSPLKR